MGVIKGICISEKRGTAKHEIEEAVFVKDWGIEKDAHAGHWHRQVSLLFSKSASGNTISMRRCYSRDDSDWKRMSQPL